LGLQGDTTGQGLTPVCSNKPQQRWSTPSGCHAMPVTSRTVHSEFGLPLGSSVAPVEPLFGLPLGSSVAPGSCFCFASWVFDRFLWSLCLGCLLGLQGHTTGQGLTPVCSNKPQQRWSTPSGCHAMRAMGQNAMILGTDCPQSGPSSFHSSRPPCSCPLSMSMQASPA
jgi:hypothetical protein